MKRSDLEVKSSETVKDCFATLCSLWSVRSSLGLFVPAPIHSFAMTGENTLTQKKLLF